jgi:hypothetical protein
MAQVWTLDWSHGRMSVHAGAGALGKTGFRLEDGRWLEPFHEAPWITQGRQVQPAGLANLRGDWCCLPFGRPYGPSDDLPAPWAGAAATSLPDAAGAMGASDDLLHGFGANAEWRLVSNAADGIVTAIEYPEDSPIHSVIRRVRPLQGRAGIDVTAEVRARRPCRRPFGFHPNFALRGSPGSFRLEPGPFRFGRTHPARDGVTKAKADATFTDLAAVPLADGGEGRFDRLPFDEDREEILQLCGIHDGIRLVNEHERVTWTLEWDSSQLPSCLLWMSNRGRHFPPWNGENLCVGVEPVASAFDLGSVVAGTANPISDHGVATAIDLVPEAPRTFRYRLTATSSLA